MIRESVKSWLKAKFGRCVTAYKAVLDWPYFGGTVALISLICSIPLVSTIKGCVDNSQGKIELAPNQLVELIDRAGAHALEKLEDEQIARATTTVVTNREPPFIKNPAGLDWFADEARRSLKKRDFGKAVELAHQAKGMIDEKIITQNESDQFLVEGAFVGNLYKTYSILAEEALSKGDYGEMQKLADTLCLIAGQFDPWSESMKKIAEVKAEGRHLVFFSSKEIRELKKLPKDKLIIYLSLLSARGYLLPVGLDYVDKTTRQIDYAAVFKLGCKLPYRGGYKIVVGSDRQHRLESNMLCSQWIGLGKTETFNLQIDAEKAMGIEDDEKKVWPITLHGEIADQMIAGSPTGDTRAELTWTRATMVDDTITTFDVVYDDWMTETIVASTHDCRQTCNNKRDVPEPTTGMLLLIGCAALALRRKA